MRVGLLGCGAVVRFCHLPALERIRDVRVVAAADPDPAALDRACGIARRHLATYARADDLLAREDVDAVVISVPTHLHADVAVAAIAAGKHVYLEKPIAASAADARRVAEAAQAAGVVGAIGFNRRSHPLYEQARALLRSGRIGRVHAVQSVFAELAHDMPAWKRARCTGGGVLLDLASHHVDLVRWFLDDEVAEATASVASHVTEQDSAHVHLVMRGGATVQSFFSFRAELADSLEFFGERGTLRVDRHRLRLTLSVARRFGYGARLSWVPPTSAIAASRLRRLVRPGEDPSYRRALRAFALAVRGGTATLPSLGDGVRSLDVVMAAEESARTGSSIRLATS